jgi:hypothetical protein
MNGEDIAAESFPPQIKAPEKPYSVSYRPLGHDSYNHLRTMMGTGAIRYGTGGKMDPWIASSLLFFPSEHYCLRYVSSITSEEKRVLGLRARWTCSSVYFPGYLDSIELSGHLKSTMHRRATLPRNISLERDGRPLLRWITPHGQNGLDLTRREASPKLRTIVVYTINE